MIDPIRKILASSSGPAIYGVFQGLLVAIAYIILKNSGKNGGLPEFAAAVSTVSLIHVFRYPQQTIAALRVSMLLSRGILFGVSQVLACLALIHGDASTAVISGTLGAIFGVLLGNLILKEKLDSHKYIALAISFIGAGINPAIFSVTALAASSGAVKGTGSVLTRKLMVQKVSPSQTVGVTCIIAALITVIATWLLGFSGEWSRMNLTYVSLLTIAILLIQYSVCFLYTISDTQRASAYTLTRIPFVLAIEWILSNQVPPGMRILSASIVIFGALLLTWFDLRNKPSTSDSRLVKESGVPT